MIVSPAVPMTVDSVNAPAMRPAAVPQSYLKIFAAATVVTRLVTQRTTRERDLRERVLLEAPEELRADLVARREEEEVEEDELDDRVDLDADLADDDAREERPDDVAELERAELEAPDEEAEGERQEDGELGVLAEGRRRRTVMPRVLSQRVTKRSHGVPTRRRTRTLKTVVIVPSL